jgi:multiple sugar transport system substrate-binding protein
MTRPNQFRVAVRKFGPFEDAIRAQWDAFEGIARTGLTLDLVPLDLHPLEEALFASGGMARGDWDIAFIATDWIGRMHQLGCALDLAPLLRDDPPQDYPSGWSDSLLRLQRIANSTLGVPYHDGPECFIYRRDLFADPALRAEYRARFSADLAPPATWADFHRIARFFHRPDRNLYGTVFAAFPDGHNTVYDFLLQLWTRDGELFDAVGNLGFATREAEAALDFYRILANDSAATHPDCTTLDSVQAGQIFAEGRVAMCINWFGFAAYAHTAADSAVRGNVAIAEIPHEPPGRSVSLNVYWILSIASGSPHPQVAWSFLRHVLTCAMDKLTTTSGAIGCRRSTWADADVNVAIPFYCSMADLHANAREIPQRADWPRIAAVIDRLVTAALTTNRPAADLLREADAEFALQ